MMPDVNNILLEIVKNKARQNFKSVDDTLAACGWKYAWENTEEVSTDNAEVEDDLVPPTQLREKILSGFQDSEQWRMEPGVLDLSTTPGIKTCWEHLV